MKRPPRQFERLEDRQLLATITWSGGGDTTAWPDTANWREGVAPSVSDTALFTAAGAGVFRGEVTNSLESDRAVGGLAYLTGSTRGHVTDLGGNALTVNGNVNFTSNHVGTGSNRIQNGTLVNESASGSLLVTGIADLSGLSAWSGDIAEFAVGDGTVDGTLVLPDHSELRVADFKVGTDWSRGTVRLPAGHSLSLGSDEIPTRLAIAEQIASEDRPGRFDASNGIRFDAQLSSLEVAVQAGRGLARGELEGAAAGDISVGSAAQPGRIIVGQATADGLADGMIDISRQNSLNAHVDELIIAQSILGRRGRSTVEPR